MKHELVRLAQAIDWSVLEERFGAAAIGSSPRAGSSPLSHEFRVFTAGQKRRVTPQIRREMRRRFAVESVIGHIKTERCMGRNHLAGERAEAVNAILAAAGYNFSLLLR